MGREPGAWWQRARIANFNRLANGHPEDVDLVADAWCDTVFPLQQTHGAGLRGGEAERTQAELADPAVMDAVRQRVSDTVRDPKTAANLMPYYRFLCKRPGFHDEYLDA